MILHVSNECKSYRHPEPRTQPLHSNTHLISEKLKRLVFEIQYILNVYDTYITTLPKHKTWNTMTPWHGNAFGITGPLYCKSSNTELWYFSVVRQSNLLTTLQWRNNEADCVSNHQPYDCLLNGLFRRRSKKTSKLRVTGLCAGIHRGPVNSPHKGPVTRKMFPFDDVIMTQSNCRWFGTHYC